MTIPFGHLLLRCRKVVEPGAGGGRILNVGVVGNFGDLAMAPLIPIINTESYVKRN